MGADLKRKAHRHVVGTPDDNPERATLNGFVRSIANMNSAILKPLSQFIPRPTKAYPNKTMGASIRQAAALVASAAANGVQMDNGAEIPRMVVLDDVEGIVENGVSCDIVTSGMATLIAAPSAAQERFLLSTNQCRVATGLVGRRKCFDLGIIATIE